MTSNALSNYSFASFFAVFERTLPHITFGVLCASVGQLDGGTGLIIPAQNWTCHYFIVQGYALFAHSHAMLCIIYINVIYQVMTPIFFILFIYLPSPPSLPDHASPATV